MKEVFNELSTSHPDLQIAAIEINDDRAGAEAFIEEHELNFIFSEADRDFVKEHFNTEYYPNTFIIDRDAVIRDHKVGFKVGDEVGIKEKLLTLLNN